MTREHTQRQPTFTQNIQTVSGILNNNNKNKSWWSVRIERAPISLTKGIFRIVFAWEQRLVVVAAQVGDGALRTLLERLGRVIAFATSNTIKPRNSYRMNIKCFKKMFFSFLCYSVVEPVCSSICFSMESRELSSRSEATCAKNLSPLPISCLSRLVSSLSYGTGPRGSASQPFSLK